MKIRLTILFFLGSLVVSAQFNPILDQYMFNGIALNPAVTGAENAFSVIGGYRAQWVGIDGAPKTQSIAAHAPLKNTKISLGLQVFADQIGVTRNTGLFSMVAYKLKFKESDLRFGLSGGINFIRNNYADLDVQDQNDNLLMNENPTGVLPDFSFGVYWHSKNHFLGFSTPFMLTHTFTGSKYAISNDFNNYNFNLNAGYIYEFNHDFNLRPSLLIKYRFNHRAQFDINLMAEMNQRIQFGLSYRTEESIMALFKYSISKQFSFMYSFGIPISALGTYTYGSHEISLKYNFFYKTTVQNPRRLL